MINSGLERQITRNNLVNIEEHTDEYIIDRRGGGGEGGQPVPSISPHQLPVNHCNRRQLERAHQKAGVADTQRCSYIQLQINKKNPLGIASERRMLAFTDANHNFKGTSKPSSIQMYAL